jgi:hypothetical protein
MLLNYLQNSSYNNLYLKRQLKGKTKYIRSIKKYKFFNFSIQKTNNLYSIRSFLNLVVEDAPKNKKKNTFLTKKIKAKETLQLTTEDTSLIDPMDLFDTTKNFKNKKNPKYKCLLSNRKYRKLFQNIENIKDIAIVTVNDSIYLPLKFKKLITTSQALFKVNSTINNQFNNNKKTQFTFSYISGLKKQKEIKEFIVSNNLQLNNLNYLNKNNLKKERNYIEFYLNFFDNFKFKYLSSYDGFNYFSLNNYNWYLYQKSVNNYKQNLNYFNINNNKYNFYLQKYIYLNYLNKSQINYIMNFVILKKKKFNCNFIYMRDYKMFQYNKWINKNSNMYGNTTSCLFFKIINNNTNFYLINNKLLVLLLNIVITFFYHFYGLINSNNFNTLLVQKLKKKYKIFFLQIFINIYIYILINICSKYMKKRGLLN